MKHLLLLVLLLLPLLAQADLLQATAIGHLLVFFVVGLVFVVLMAVLAFASAVAPLAQAAPMARPAACGVDGAVCCPRPPAGLARRARTKPNG